MSQLRCIWHVNESINWQMLTCLDYYLINQVNWQLTDEDNNVVSCCFFCCFFWLWVSLNKNLLYYIIYNFNSYAWNVPYLSVLKFEQTRSNGAVKTAFDIQVDGPRWHGNSWQRGIAESGSSRPSALMIDIPGDLVWDLPCVQPASYLEGGPLVWMLPLYLHVNQKSDYDDNMIASPFYLLLTCLKLLNKW